MKWNWLHRLRESWKDVPESNPPLWRGPRVEIPEEIKRRGIDCVKYGIDPKRVARFQVFSNEMGISESSQKELRDSKRS